jgi:hypothetical protein
LCPFRSAGRRIRGLPSGSRQCCGEVVCVVLLMRVDNAPRDSSSGVLILYVNAGVGSKLEKLGKLMPWPNVDMCATPLGRFELILFCFRESIRSAVVVWTGKLRNWNAPMSPRHVLAMDGRRSDLCGQNASRGTT